MGCPCPSDRAASSDDSVGEVEEGVDDGGAAFVTAGEPVKGVLPGVGALYVPTPGGLNRCLLALVRDSAVQSAFDEGDAGFPES